MRIQLRTYGRARTEYPKVSGERAKIVLESDPSAERRFRIEIDANDPRMLEGTVFLSLIEFVQDKDTPWKEVPTRKFSTFVNLLEREREWRAARDVAQQEVREHAPDGTYDDPIEKSPGGTD